MSVSKKENKEDAVQLTQEDIQILSEYSWDMGEYTSRFGFFYLGSDKENVKGLTKWQAEHIYQLTPTPPGMEDPLQNMEKNKRIDKEKQKEIQKQNEVIADEYIVRVVQQKNLLYLIFSSMAMNTGSTERFTLSSEETAWILTILYCFWT